MLRLLFNHYIQCFFFLLLEVFKCVVTKGIVILVQIRNDLMYLIDINEAINGRKD